MISALLCTVIAAQQPIAQQGNEERVRFFEAKVRPILVKHCLKCHGKDEQSAGLRLDSRSAILKGGASGPALIPGRAKESLLIQVTRTADEESRMPKNGRLKKNEIDTLIRWVEGGAAFPKATQGLRLRDPTHWSFQPLAQVSPRSTKNAVWSQTAIDRFILARLEAENLGPAIRADKRTLIRRVTFGLTGLPPTPDEIEAFVNDTSPNAWANVVDRLLASPRYGERWGRHWLDVARYADSNGFDENVAHGNAWRYRDYVVSGFNRDKPFDRFIVEQLAGDLLPFSGEAQRREQLVATGFLSIGPKVLAETDQAKMRMDIIDEQLDTVGRAFLGLTIGCARCHDHKFDPITTADYYALAGIFKSTLTMRKYIKVAEWHEHVLPSPEARRAQAEYDNKVRASKRSIDDLRWRIAASAGVEALAVGEESKTSPELKKLEDALAVLEKAGPELPTAMGVTEDKVVDVAVHLRGDTQKLGDTVKRRTPGVIKGPSQPVFTTRRSGREELARWLVEPRNPLTARVIVNRVWRWHFGRGLVASTDNFGLLGDRPTHPKLLDWLARRFIQTGWSIKELHRLILLSSVYQQSSRVELSQQLNREQAVVLTQKQSQLFGRYEVRRLEAESVRDSLLFVSGQLDESMGGSLLKLKNRSYFFDHTSIDKTTYDTRRRSIYLPVVRNHIYDVFQLLDFPDPAVTTGNRSSTVVASQALLMMNSELVMKAANQLAMTLLNRTGTDGERLDLLYQVTLGRSPSLEERDADLQLIQQTMVGHGEESSKKQRVASWTTLCHVVLASNEYVYVR